MKNPNPARREDWEASAGCSLLPGMGWGLQDHAGPWLSLPRCQPPSFH